MWCSVHTPTQEQMSELQEIGEVVLLKDLNSKLQNKINNSPGNRDELVDILAEVVETAGDNNITHLAQLGGSPLFICLAGAMIPPSQMVFAHSERISVDEPQPDGSIKKTSIFKHINFI